MRGLGKGIPLRSHAVTTKQTRTQNREEQSNGQGVEEKRHEIAEEHETAK